MYIRHTKRPKLDNELASLNVLVYIMSAYTYLCMYTYGLTFIHTLYIHAIQMLRWLLTVTLMDCLASFGPWGNMYTYKNVYVHAYTYIPYTLRPQTALFMANPRKLDIGNGSIRLYVYICIWITSYTYIRIYTFIWIYMYTYVYRSPLIHTCIHTNIHTHIHTYEYTFKHTYVYTYISIYDRRIF